MRAPRTLLLIALTVLLACLAALPAGPTAAQELAGVYDGEWTGTTSQGQPISFTVAGDIVTRIVVKVRIAPCTITSTTTGAIPIVGNSFSATSYDQGITGTFDTATSASGTGFLTSSNQVCPGTANLTWTATRPPPLTYSIGGTVRDGSGAPVSGAQISVVPPTGGQPITGADGSYALSVPAGTYTLLAAKDGYIAGAPVTVTVPPDKADADLLLTPVDRPTVRGTVRDPGGAPVAGALVMASPRSGGTLAEAQTDAAGAYTLTLDPGSYDLQASKQGFTAAQVFNVTVPPSQTGVDMRLGAVTATISGTVRDDKGAPVGGAEVRAQPAPGSQSPVTTASAADGSYTLSVPAGTYSVQAARDGYTPSPALAVTVPPDRTGVDLLLTGNDASRSIVYLPLLAKPVPAAPPTPVPPTPVPPTPTPTPPVQGPGTSFYLCTDRQRSPSEFLTTAPCSSFDSQLFLYAGTSLDKRDFALTLSGDLTGSAYTFNVFLASRSSTTFEVSAILLHNGGEQTLASTRFTATSTTFTAFNATVAGIDGAAVNGDVLVVRVRSLSGGDAAIRITNSSQNFLTIK